VPTNIKNDEAVSFLCIFRTPRSDPRSRRHAGAMQARRGGNFATNAVPFFAFMVGGSYGISILLQVRSTETRG
jgi:hypothetical protein